MMNKCIPIILLLFSLMACRNDTEVKPTEKAKEIKPSDTWSRIKDSEKEIRNILQGEWGSIEDSLYLMVFEGDSVYDVFDEDIDEAGRFYISKNCPDADQSENADKQHMILVKAGDNLCYSILLVNETDLQLLYLAKGNMLSFKRNSE